LSVAKILLQKLNHNIFTKLNSTKVDLMRSYTIFSYLIILLIFIWLFLSFAMIYRNFLHGLNEQILKQNNLIIRAINSEILEPISVKEKIDLMLFDKETCYFATDANFDLIASSTNFKNTEFQKSQFLKDENFRKFFDDKNSISRKKNTSFIKIDQCIFTQMQKSPDRKFFIITGYSQAKFYEKIIFYLSGSILYSLGIAAFFLLAIFVFKKRQISPFMLQMLKAKEEADAAKAAKSQFLSNMSHELRTPMNGIIGLSQVLCESKNLKRDEIEQVNTIYRSSEVMLKILNDILNFSKIEAQQISVENSVFNIDNLVEDLASLMSPMAHSKGLEIITNLKKEVPQFLISDTKILHQILNNLINNAIKFTNSGQILIEVSLAKIVDQKFFIQFSVKDSGIGIDAQKIKSIFKAFSQGDMSTTKKHGGVGLGLSICSKLVDLLEGKISVSSKVGEESNFSFIVPMLVKKDFVSLFEQEKQKIVGRKIIAIEGNEEAIKIMTNDFKYLQLEHQVLDGKKIKNSRLVLEELKNNSDINAIIISHNSQLGINAINIANKIKDEETLKNIPLILLILPEEKIKFSAKKLEFFNQIILKPQRKNKLISALFAAFKIDYFGDENDIEHNSQTKRQPLELGGLKVLLCEDNEVNLKVATTILKRLNFNIDVAKNGEEAVEKFREKRYDFILMDCMMPVMDGFEATKKIREIEIEKNAQKPILIFALSANSSQEDREKCIKSGMTDFLAKPFKYQSIEELLINWINKN